MSATVTRLPEPAEFRYLAFRYQDPRPDAGSGLAFTQWCIEEQIARAFDLGDAATGYAVLAAFNPALDIERVDELLDLADEVRDQEVNGTREAWYAAIDSYANALRLLAGKVRAS